jgi:FlaA1/EpsC-like NDP-sugar epimerase
MKLFIDLASPVLALPRIAKRGVVMVLDASFCVLCLWLSYYLRLGEFVSLSGNAMWAALIAIGIAIPVFTILGLYRAIFRYSGWLALIQVASAVGIYGLIYASVFTAVGVIDVPRTVGIIQPILLLLFVGASRSFARVWLGDKQKGLLNYSLRPKVFIYGAGQSGRQLAAAMANSHEMLVVGFLDDDERLHGQVLNGKNIYNPADLKSLVATFRISNVFMAMPSLTRKRRNEILAQMRGAQVSVRTLPSMTELVQGKVSISDLRELDIDDLLGRDAVEPDPLLLRKNIAEKVVLVTGAGGSIGSELCRQILSVGPTKLLLIEQSEFALYAIHQELQVKLLDRSIELIPLIASVQDAKRMQKIMQTWRPHTVYHAAAYKHVPLVEHNPSEGLRNNTLGTWITAQESIRAGVKDFVLISTDKAVRPTNVMGASKRLAEMVLQALACDDRTSSTSFSMVRFGNVLGSSGSVVPLFRKQIKNGGPITITHLEITRYFMTIPEAATLVIQAGAMARGGDVFVLDMGEPVKIIDLAERMVALSGLTVSDEDYPEGNISIEVTGLRPGEKLYEELLIGDNPLPTQHPRIMKANESFLPWDQLVPYMDQLEVAIHLNDVSKIRMLLQSIVTGYQPQEQQVDWIYMENKKVELHQ